MDSLVANIKEYGPAITIVLGILTATPPVYRKFIRPVLLWLRNMLFRDFIEAIKKAELHQRSTSIHLNRKQRKILNDIEKERQTSD